MRLRDIATIAFRMFALSVVASALLAIIETVTTWRAIAAQTMSSFSGVTNAPTEGQYFWMAVSALLGRALVGLVLWFVAPILARVTAPADLTPSSSPSRQSLYEAAAFLVGVWLLSESVPALSYALFFAMRTGRALLGDEIPGAKVPYSAAQLVLGFLFLRGGWLARWALAVPQQSEEGA